MEATAIKETLEQDSAPEAQKFEHWCIIELFGHNRIAGLVTEATLGGCSFLRVDVPTHDGEGTMYTKYFGNGAIYAINVTTKEEVLKAVQWMHPKPPTPRVSEQKALPEAEEDYIDSDGDDVDDDLDHSY